MLLMIDNYDSFTYNLVQYFGELGVEVRVFRNDQITLEGIAGLQPRQLVLSPGPCTPAEAGICIDAIRHFRGRLPILGVCLGHQAIGAALGGRGVFAGLPERFTVNRYHSLVIERASLPVDLEVSASAEDDGEIMAVRDRTLAGTTTPLEGVQFHPESIISEHGHALLKNFVDGVR
jgi:anthranilate synthase component 2